jgi:hypothetical protein
MPQAMPSRRPARWLLRFPAVAGITYTVVWIVGLAIWPINLAVNATDAEVISAFSGHQAVGMLQYLLVEGIAGLALAGVVLALGRASRQRGANQLGLAAVVVGLSAAAVSMSQCVLGVLMSGWLIPQHATSQVGNIFSLVNRLDGVKMFLLALLAIVGVGLIRQVRVLPRWLAFAGVLLALAMLASGVGYLLLNPALSMAAAVSLPLVLIWVTGAGLSLAWANRHRG